MPQDLPPGYSWRRATTSDAFELADLQNTIDRDEGAAAWNSADDYLEDWAHPNANIEEQSWVVTVAGAIVAFAEAFDNKSDGRELEIFMMVHPSHRGVGLEEWLFDRGVDALTPLAGDGAILRSYTSALNPVAIDLLESRGLQPVRTFWHMEIELPPGYSAPPAPAGIAIRPWRGEAEAEEFHAVFQASFADHFGWAPTPFDRWWQGQVERSDFDPSLSLVAREDDRIVGISLNGIAVERGWVSDLGVLHHARGRGIARALLQHSFEVFAARGFAKVGLGVDSSNPTGATKLYESVGMYVTRKFEAYERPVEKMKV